MQYKHNNIMEKGNLATKMLKVQIFAIWHIAEINNVATHCM